jgi:acyl-CoA synthetase (AMP-forming)/AMP-acid ligase II
MSTPADVIRKLLADAGKLTATFPGFSGGLPLTTADDAVGLYDTGGTTEGRAKGVLVTHPGLQVRVRSKDRGEGYEKLSSIIDELAAVRNREVVMQPGVEVWSVAAFTLTSTPAQLGQEEKNRRFHFSANGTLTLRRTT